MNPASPGDETAAARAAALGALASASGFDPAALLDMAPVMIGVHEGPDHRYVYSNAAHDSAVGNRPLIGLPLREAMPELAGQDIFEVFDRVYRTGKSERRPAFRAVLRTPAGETVAGWYRQSVQPWLGADGTVRGVISFAYDVTAQVEAAEMVERRTAELGFALEVGGGVGTWDWDVAGDTLKVNERFATFFGIPPGEAQGLPLERFIAAILPEDRARVERAIADAVAQGSDYHQDYRVRTIDGEIRRLTARGRCFHDAEGTPLRFPGVAIDITQQVEERHQLERTYALLKSFLDNSATYVFAKDLEGRYILANRFYLEAFGETEASLYGRTDRDRFGEDEPFSINDRRVAESGEAIEFEEQAVGASGETIHAISVKFPLRDPAGNLFGTGSVSSDVTLRRRTEAALARSEDRRLRAMAAGSVGTFEYYQNEDRFVWDDLTASILGFGSGGAMSLRRIAARVHPDDRKHWDESIARALSSPDNKLQVAFRVTRPEDGATRWIEAVAEASTSPEQPLMMVGTVRDITEHKANEEQLVYLNRELNHRVKNLFAVTRGMIRMAARHDPSAGAFAQRAVDRLDALAAAHTIGLDAHAAEPVDLADMLAAILRPFADHEQQAIYMEGPPVAVPRRMVTPLTLTIYELATNAFKYGCLARSDGRLVIAWHEIREGGADAPPALRIAWDEDCGEAVSPPGEEAGSGFGQRLINALIVQMSGHQKADWAETGLRMTLTLPLEVTE